LIRVQCPPLAAGKLHENKGKNVFYLRCAAIAVCLLLPPGIGFAHPGGLAADGCHYCRSNCAKWGVAAGSRHCHRGEKPKKREKFQRDGGEKPPLIKQSGAFSRSEKHYSDAWCAKHGGISQAVLGDGTRPDCVLKSQVVEFDWGKGMKPYECSGQASHYASVTGKMPLCVLIQSARIGDDEFAQAVRKVAVPVKCMDRFGAIFDCPQAE
jgi:hypothetical protein